MAGYLRRLGPLVLVLYLAGTAWALVIAAPIEATALGNRLAQPVLVVLPTIVSVLVFHLILVSTIFLGYLLSIRHLLRVRPETLPSSYVFQSLGAGHLPFGLLSAIMTLGLIIIRSRYGGDILDSRASESATRFVTSLTAFRPACWLSIFVIANLLIARHVSRGMFVVTVATGLPVLAGFLLVDILTAP